MLSDDLSWFLVLAETEHVGEAAAELHVPQPTLSRRLARLERRLGTPLFDRRGRSLSLNSRGRTLRSRIQAAVTQLDLGEAEVHKLLDPETGLVRFDFLHSLGSWMAPRLIRSFVTRHPRAEIRLHQGGGPELFQRLRADETDIVLSSPRPEDPGISWMELHRQPLGLCLPADHPLAGRESLSIGDARSEPFVSTPTNYGSRALLHDVADEAGVDLHVAYESNELSTVAGLVVAGVGIAVLPLDDPHLQLPGTTFVPLQTRHTREIGLMWRGELNLTSTIGMFLSEAKTELTER
ncbi:MAG: LysR family transcriptional regulator [Ancrocorticia sp.]|uniref:LysR family transcriptional regulator n=1 Tax=Ancrocorticia sp. TaxID=2593684 RepID=UPI003F93581A